MNVIDILLERGFIEQTTHDEELRRYADKEQITCYIGFDPTASSLHIGSLVPIMSLAHMQRLGHRPIALVGGGTGLVGDPSGKTEMRQLLTPEIVEENERGIKKQLSRFIDFNDDNHFIGFMRQNQLLNHKLTELLKKIRKNDSDFDVEYITETIDFYDRFLESRYPYSNGNNHDDIFQFNKSNYIKYDDLRQLLREKIKSNIRLF